MLLWCIYILSITRILFFFVDIRLSITIVHSPFVVMFVGLWAWMQYYYDEFSMYNVWIVILFPSSQFKGSSPSSCWNKIYEKMRQLQNGSSDDSQTEKRVEATCKSGSYMFGFSIPEVAKLIQVKYCEKSRRLVFWCSILWIGL